MTAEQKRNLLPKCLLLLFIQSKSHSAPKTPPKAAPPRCPPPLRVLPRGSAGVALAGGQRGGQYHHVHATTSASEGGSERAETSGADEQNGEGQPEDRVLLRGVENGGGVLLMAPWRERKVMEKDEEVGKRWSP